MAQCHQECHHIQVSAFPPSETHVQGCVGAQLGARLTQSVKPPPHAGGTHECHQKARPGPRCVARAACGTALRSIQPEASSPVRGAAF